MLIGTILRHRVSARQPRRRPGFPGNVLCAQIGYADRAQELLPATDLGRVSFVLCTAASFEIRLPRRA
jgi:hypothetical protein